MKDPRKKRKQKLSYAIKNNVYLLRLAAKASLKRVVWEFVNRACEYFSWMFISVVLLEYILDGIEKKVGF